jgi:hypothetical protein
MGEETQDLHARPPLLDRCCGSGELVERILRAALATRRTVATPGEVRKILGPAQQPLSNV